MYIVLSKIEDELHIFEIPKIIQDGYPILAATPIYRKAEEFARKHAPSVVCEFKHVDGAFVDGYVIKTIDFST
jgi:hypothetical protein